MASVQRSAFEIAQSLSQHSAEFPDSLQDDLQTVLSRFFELENARKNQVKSQVAYHQRVAQSNPEMKAKKLQKDNERKMQRYRTDPAFREKIREAQRKQYARTKISDFPS